MRFDLQLVLELAEETVCAEENPSDLSKVVSADEFARQMHRRTV